MEEWVVIKCEQIAAQLQCVLWSTDMHKKRKGKKNGSREKVGGEGGLLPGSAANNSDTLVGEVKVMVPLGGVPLGSFKVIKLLGDPRETKGSCSRNDNVGVHLSSLASKAVCPVKDPLLQVLMPFCTGDLRAETDLFVEVVLFGDPALVLPNLLVSRKP